MVGVWGSGVVFGFGESFFLRRALRFLRCAWAVLERPLRDGGSGVLGRGLRDGGLFSGCGGGWGSPFGPALPGIPRSCCRTVWGFAPPYVFDEGGGGSALPSLPPHPGPLPPTGSFAQPASMGIFGLRRPSTPLCPSDISPASGGNPRVVQRSPSRRGVSWHVRAILGFLLSRE